jgi:RimJ/RimL family protein N-acetyltransferase
VVSLRPAAAADCRRIWLWRNDDDTRRASLDSAPIPWETHERWFGEALASDRRKIFVVVAEGRDAGVVRLDLDGGRGTVSIHLAPERRGQGLGPAALDALAEVAFDALGVAELIALVKPDNQASLSAFAKAGFSVTRPGPVVVLARVRRPRAPAPHPASPGLDAGHRA